MDLEQLKDSFVRYSAGEFDDFLSVCEFYLTLSEGERTLFVEEQDGIDTALLKELSTADERFGEQLRKDLRRDHGVKIDDIQGSPFLEYVRSQKLLIDPTYHAMQAGEDREDIHKHISY